MKRFRSVQQWTASLASAALQQLAMGVIVAAQDGRVCQLNQAARDILAAEDGLMLRDCFLAARRRFETARLHSAIDRAANREAIGENHADGLAIARSSRQDPYLLLISPLSFEPSAVESGTKLALILVGDPGFRDRMLAARLSRTFGLTSAETRLAAYLAHGQRLAAIARETGLALSTLRTQLQAVFKKTETTRQADLIRIVLGMPMVCEQQMPERRAS
jgi:DNA-binding CsgD family transcriptional regulator